MKVALCQINTTVGDFEGNAAKILEFAKTAKKMRAEIALFPELAIGGYPAQDLLLRPEFLAEAQATIKAISKKAVLPCLIGTISENKATYGKPLYNSMAYIRDKSSEIIARKSLLPTYDVFDESRYFEPALVQSSLKWKGKTVGLTICEDIWNDKGFWPKQSYKTDPVARLDRHGFDAIINISASPYEIGKPYLRRRMMSAMARKYRRPLIHVNLVGANDELLFDGNSLVMNEKGQLVWHAKGFEEDIGVIDIKVKNRHIKKPYISSVEETKNALVMGVRDYVQKNGFSQVVLGLSGGIDSSVTAAIAVEALGPKNVLGVLMPGPYSSKGSVDDSVALAKALKINTETVNISTLCKAYEKAMSPVFSGKKKDVTEENLQARIRGNVLMSISNKFGSLLLTTGNKSEMTVGYATLYGDMCGGLAVLSDVIKDTVYSIGKIYNRDKVIIPDDVFTKPPSAELAPDQKDSDSLPPYDLVDTFIHKYVEQQQPIDACVEGKLTKTLAEKLVTLTDGAEFKRRQAAPTLKVTQRAFGIGWRVPVSRKKFTKKKK